MNHVKKMPEVIELRLKSSKAVPRAMDKIIMSLNHSPCIKILSLSDMSLSER